MSCNFTSTGTLFRVGNYLVFQSPKISKKTQTSEYRLEPRTLPKRPAGSNEGGES